MLKPLEKLQLLIKIALEEAFTPKLQSILSKKLQSEMEEEEDEVEEVAEEVDSSGIGSGDNKEPEYDEIILS